MAAHHTALYLQDLLCTSITSKVFDNETVQIAIYQDSFHEALIYQQQIGWQHMYVGHWCSKWEMLVHNIYTTLHSTEFIWTLTLVESSLTLMIQLWEQGNSNVHGNSESKQKQKLLQQQKLLISDLLSRQGWCLPRDQFLFPENPQELLEKTFTFELGNWQKTSNIEEREIG